MNEEENKAFDEQEFEAAMEAAKTARDSYEYSFDPPFFFEGESFDRLHFDFGALTAADALAIDAELNALGRYIAAPEFSGEFLIRMAMRACTDRRRDGRKLGVDAFYAMPLKAYVRISGRARSFLLRAGS